MCIDSDFKDCDVVILCGGLGTRIKKIIKEKPKALVHIDGFPFIWYLMNYFSSWGLRRFILCTGYRGDQIEKYFKNQSYPDLEILFSRETKQLGTGGAIRNAKHLIKSNPFLVVNGDTFCRVDLKKFLRVHLQKKAILSMVLVRSQKSEGTGIVKIDASGSVIGYNEKKNDNSGRALINAGIYLMNLALLSKPASFMNNSLEYNVFPKIIKKRFFGFVNKGSFLDIGTPENYRKAEKFLSNNRNLKLFFKENNDVRKE